MVREVTSHTGRSSLLCLVFLAVLLLGAPVVAGPAAPAIWFDDIKSPFQVTAPDTGGLMRVVQALVSGSEPDAASLSSALQEDKDLRLVFLSVSDGMSRARVVRGSGRGLLEAVRDAAARARSFLNEGYKPRWVRLDIVSEKPVRAIADPSRPLPLDQGTHGLAFERSTGAAFLPARLSSSSALEKDGRMNKANLLLELDIQADRQKVKDLLRTDKIVIFRFRTIGLFSAGGSTYLLKGTHRQVAGPSQEELLIAASLGGNYLSRNVDELGRFLYFYDPGSGEQSDRYNMVRHAGTIYAMMELYEQTREQELQGASRRAIAYLLDRVMPCGEAAICVVENGQTKLGGNALAALALAKYTEVTGDRTYASEIRALGNWILGAQSRSGRFAVQKQAYPGGRVERYESEYYPGEALFALTRIYRTDPDPRWLDAAERGARYLIGRQQWPWMWRTPHDHWLLYALNELHRLRPDPSYLDHAMRIARAISESQRRDPDDPDRLGAYSDSGGSTAAATRTEGLCAAYCLARDFDRPDDAAVLLEAIRLGITFQLRTQFTPESVMYLDDPLRALGGFRESLTERGVRIDFVQHNVSAILGLYRIMSRPDGGHSQHRDAEPFFAYGTRWLPSGRLWYHPPNPSIHFT